MNHLSHEVSSECSAQESADKCAVKKTSSREYDPERFKYRIRPDGTVDTTGWELEHSSLYQILPPSEEKIEMLKRMHQRMLKKRSLKPIYQEEPNYSILFNYIDRKKRICKWIKKGKKNAAQISRILQHLKSSYYWWKLPNYRAKKKGEKTVESVAAPHRLVSPSARNSPDAAQVPGSRFVRNPREPAKNRGKRGRSRKV